MPSLAVRRIRIWARAASVLTTLGVLLCVGGSQLSLAQDLGSFAGSPGTHGESAKNGLKQGFGRLPMSFEPNRGQADGRVQFLSRGRDYTLFLTSDAAVLSFARPAKGAEAAPAAAEWWKPMATKAPAPRKLSVLRMRLVGAHANAPVRGLDELPGKANYLHGSNPAAWRTNVPTYARVQYADVYPGVDLVYYGNQGQLEYDLLLAPGADPGRIGLSFAGAQRLRVDAKTGDLTLKVGGSEVRFRQPVVYQMEGSRRQTVEGSYTLTGRNRVGFHLGAYDRNRPLVIDPSLVFSTYLGGSLAEVGSSIAVDSGKNVYVAGYTQSSDFPTTPGAYDTTCGTDGTCNGSQYDIFVTKLNSTGTALTYSTYIGGSQSDYAFGLALDPGGNVYLTGQTYSSDFPIVGGFQTTCAAGCLNGDAFILKLNPTGSSLVYSTYIGGSGYDGGDSIALDSAGNVYVAGQTLSTDFPVTPGAFQTSASGTILPTGFVAKVNPRGSGLAQLIYSTFLGGSDDTIPYSLALDSSGDAFVVGQTNSTDYPTTPGALQTSLNALTSGYLTKLNPTGSALVYSTYVGGSSTSTDPCAACATGVAVDQSGNAYVVGLAYVTDLPVTAGAFQTKFAGGFHDAFIIKLNSTGTGVIYGSYLGGTTDDGAVTVSVDSAGDAYVRGNAFSQDFPVTPNAFQTANNLGHSDAWITEFNPTGTGLLYSTYLGGTLDEFGHATRSLALDGKTSPNVYVTGFTDSLDYPVTAGAVQTTFGGLCDAFVTKLGPFNGTTTLTPLNLTFTSQMVGTSSPPQTVTLTNSGPSALSITSIGFTGTNPGDFSQTNTCGTSLAAGGACAINVTFTPTASGTRAATVSVTDNASGTYTTVPLTGNGVSSSVTLSPASVNFGVVLLGIKSPAANLTLTNSSSSIVNITSISIGGTNSGDFSQTNNCGSSLAVGASCTISATFKPSAVNTRTATVSVTDDASGSPQMASLTGTGTQVRLSPTSLSFGSVTVGSSVSMPVTLTNVSKTSVLSITSININGTNASDYSQTNNCGSSVAAGKNCTITVTFTPSATGTRTATVGVTDNGGGSPQKVTLTGSGQ